MEVCGDDSPRVGKVSALRVVALDLGVLEICAVDLIRPKRGTVVSDGCAKCATRFLKMEG